MASFHEEGILPDSQIMLVEEEFSSNPGEGGLKIDNISRLDRLQFHWIYLRHLSTH